MIGTSSCSNSRNIVRDLVTLRQSLGYEQWNLHGSSFSTSLMLLLMEADPDGTRSAILQSVKPPNETTFAHEADSPLRAIELMFADCEADEHCAASYPDLAGDFYELVRRLNREPLEVEIDGSADAEGLPITFDGHHLVDWIVINQLYRPVFPDHDAAYLPLLIDEVHRGNVGLLDIAARSFWASSIEDPNWAWGLMFAVNCQQDLPAAGPARPAADLAASELLDGFARSSSQRAICEAWDLAPQSPAAVGYVRSDRPVLVLAGSYDPVTPPSWSRTTAEHLPNSTYVEFPGHGHDVTTDNPCAARLISLRHRTRETTDRTALIAYALALPATLAALAVGFLVDQVTDDYASRSQLAYALGPSRDLMSARLLAWIAPLAGLVILALATTAVWAWVSRRWSTGFRLLTTTSAFCTFAIVVLGTRWDLFTMLL